MDIVEHNREAWTREVESGNKLTIPVDAGTIDKARRGQWSLLLTPTIGAPRDWFGELAGARVTVFDNCPSQLAGDRLVGEREGLEIRLVQGDMRDLSAFPDASFDLKAWDEAKDLKVRYSIPYSDLGQLPPEELAAKLKENDALEYGHSLDTQIGGQIKAGFALTGFYEDISGWDLLDPHIKTFIATRAAKA